jgi:RNA polymerase subunit RPABC4/transcription elongation factor Spt4
MSVLLLFLFVHFSKAQTISFRPIWGAEQAEINKGYFSTTVHDSIYLNTLRFYVSKVCFYKNGKKVFQEKQSFHLLDWEDKMNCSLRSNAEFDAISFCIGVDSVTNVSGALGGDLDPTKGMYWTWQSGYINFKIEGSCAVCNTRNHTFQWHVGGYRFPDATIQEVQLACNNQKEIVVAVDLKKLFELSNIAEQPEVMSPGKKAVQLSANFKTCFSMFHD